MDSEEKYKGLTWMTDEMRSHLIYRDKIVSDENMNELFNLKDNSDFSIALHEILVNKYEKSALAFNGTQLNLFLCIHLENAGQSGHILSFLQEWFPHHSENVIIALNEIGAVKSSEIIKQAVELLPKDGSWFFDSADESTTKLMSKLDGEFSNYPDGNLNDLCRKYAEINKNDLLF